MGMGTNGGMNMGMGMNGGMNMGVGMNGGMGMGMGMNGGMGMGMNGGSQSFGMGAMSSALPTQQQQQVQNTGNNAGDWVSF